MKSAPEILKADRRERRVARRMLNGDVPQPILNGARILSFVRQSVPATVAQHVEVNRQRQLSARPQRLYKPIESARREWCPALARENVRAVGIQLAKCSQHSQLIALDRVRRGI